MCTARIGQPFTVDDEVEGRDRVAIISDGLWRTRFGADAEIVGKTMQFDAGTMTIHSTAPVAAIVGVCEVAQQANLATMIDLVFSHVKPHPVRVQAGRTRNGASSRASSRTLSAASVASRPRRSPSR